MLVATTLLQTAVAVLFCIAWVQTIREYLADTDLRVYARPFFMHLTPSCVTLANVLLAIGLLAALCTRRNPERSQRFLLLAFATGLPLQITPHLVPGAWSYAFPEAMREQATEVLAKFAPLSSLGGTIDVLPFLLSIAVGLSRAGLRRVKQQPESPIGATMAFAASLQLSLFATVALAFAEPLLPKGWAPIGLCLLALHYGAAAAICFLLAKDGRGRSAAMRRLLTLSTCVLLLPGVLVLFVGLWNLEVWGIHLFGWGDREGLIAPSELPQHVLLFACRSLITALAASDLLARSSRGNAN